MAKNGSTNIEDIKQEFDALVILLTNRNKSVVDINLLTVDSLQRGVKYVHDF